MHPPTSPTCWQCGYALTGLKVDDVCPECGTAVWSSPILRPDVLARDASRALTWGVVAIALFFIAIGPLAGLVAIPAIRTSSRIKRECGGSWPVQLGNAKAAWWLGWITATLSLLFMAVYGAILIAMVL